MASLPTLRQLNYFVLLSETLHFSKAAERAFVTQSSFSMGILELEKQLGGVLFERDNRNVRLSALGETLLPKAKQLLTDATDFVNINNNLQHPFATPINLVIIPSILPFVLGPLTQHIKQHHPTITLNIKELQSEAALTALTETKVDMVLMAEPYNLTGFLSTALIDEPLYWVGHADLARKMKLSQTTSFFDLDLEQLILLEEGHCLSDHTLSACPRETVKSFKNSPKAFEVNSLMALYTLLQNQYGYSLLPQMAIKSAGFADDLTSLLITDAPARTISLVTRPTLAKPFEYDALKNIFQTVFQQH